MTAWTPAFVAVGTLIGEPIEAIASALEAPDREPAADLLRALKAPSRDVRARALARVLTEVAIAIEAVKPT